MTEYLPGGRRRLDRVLDPTYLEGIEELDLVELRDLRTQADQEEADLSYNRRLLQGRLDLLLAERNRRAGNGSLMPPGTRTDDQIVAELTRVLTQDRPPARGAGRHLSLEPSRIGEHRREAERVVADLAVADPSLLTDAQLDEVIERIGAIEARVSRTRRSVQQVVDAIAAEIARRFLRQQLAAQN